MGGGEKGNQCIKNLYCQNKLGEMKLYPERRKSLSSG